MPLLLHVPAPEVIYHLLGRIVENWEADRAMAEMQLTVVLGELERSHQEQQRSPAEAMIDACCERIRTEPEAAHRVADLASTCGWSRHHFSRCFRSRTGLSPQEYVVAQRLRAARAMLVRSDLPVGRIADLLGYADIFFFSKQFRAKVGLSPTAYRQHHCNE